ncbi:MAG: hypothetical protein KF794_01895 [Xanthobacteraceae bacterium]|nr:hypothetical protein [Xanthobacteraceae bacterium]QYK45486.1 MAG: hypothetical protein KF794_01895 [Xanthobacteraceae bacterium]
MLRSLSFKGICVACALYALCAFAIESIDGNLNLAALKPLFTGEAKNAVIPQRGDEGWIVGFRMAGLGLLILVFTGMFVYLSLQAFIPVTISALLLTLVLPRLGRSSVPWFALGGLVCGALICGLVTWQGRQLNWQTAAFILAYGSVGMVLYRLVAGAPKRASA